MSTAPEPTFAPCSVAPTTELLLRWAAAVEDFSPIHFDRDAAAARGFDSPLVHGPWKAAVLRILLTRWLGPHAQIHTLSTRYLNPDTVGSALQFAGHVVGSAPTSDGATEVHCALSVRDDRGRVTVEGEAVATITPDSGERLPMERLRAALRLGEEAGRFTYRVQANDVEAFAAAYPGEPASGAPPLHSPEARRWLRRWFDFRDNSRRGGWDSLRDWKKALEAEWRREFRTVIEKKPASPSVRTDAGTGGVWALKQRLDAVRAEIAEHPAREGSRAYAGDGLVTPEMEADLARLRKETAELEGAIRS